MMMPANFFKNIPDNLPEELIEVIGGSENVKIERIVSRGHASPPDFWYRQDQHEFILLLKGQAQLSFQTPDDRLILNPGDYITISAQRPHRVDWTAANEETLWLTVFY